MNPANPEIPFPFPVGEVTTEEEVAIPQGLTEIKTPEQEETKSPAAGTKEQLPKPDPGPDDATVKAERLQHALHESRQQAKEAKEQAENLRVEMQEREQRMAEFVRQKMESMEQKQAKAEGPKPPDPTEDPMGHMRWQNEQLRQRLESLEGNQAQVTQAQHQNDQLYAIQNNIQAQEQQFARQQPDYYDAVKHVQDHVAMVLETQGYQPPQVVEEVQKWGMQFGAMQLQNRQNPAAKFYELAGKLGYKLPEPKSELEQSAAGSPQAVLDQIEKGQKQQGLGSGGGQISDEETDAHDEFPLLTQAMKELGLPV